VKALAYSGGVQGWGEIPEGRGKQGRGYQSKKYSWGSGVQNGLSVRAEGGGGQKKHKNVSEKGKMGERLKRKKGKPGQGPPTGRNRAC